MRFVMKIVLLQADTLCCRHRNSGTMKRKCDNVQPMHLLRSDAKRQQQRPTA